MSWLSDTQWNDAFRAAGYSEEHSRRYIAKIKSKVRLSSPISDVEMMNSAEDSADRFLDAATPGFDSAE